MPAYSHKARCSVKYIIPETPEELIREKLHAKRYKHQKVPFVQAHLDALDADRAEERDAAERARQEASNESHLREIREMRNDARNSSRVTTPINIVMAIMTLIGTFIAVWAFFGG